jgi:hypothetical protein
MVNLKSLLVVAALALTTAACVTTDNGSDQPPPVNNNVTTTGVQPEVQQAQAPGDEAQETVSQERAEELPATGSPLALTGLLGVLSVAGVLISRLVGRL